MVPASSSTMKLLFLSASYALASIPFGLVLSRRFAGLDVRSVGSGNIGATNVARAAGKGVAAWVLLLDAAKGFVPVWIARTLWGEEQAWIAAVGFSAFLGHVFPVYLRFRGGKGVATALGVCLALLPWVAIAGALTWAVVVSRTKKSSLGSLFGAGVALFLAYRAPAHPAYPMLLTAMAGLIFLRHRDNIRRLLAGKEL